jgi:hypothetical protein
MDSLVPGRECGGCAVCCITPLIEAPELRKPAGVRCPNCRRDNLCAIYERRPKPCRDFFCGWRLIAQLGDDWRPDRCGIFLMPAERPTSPMDSRNNGVQILLADAAAIRKREFPGLVAAWVDAGLPVFLALSLPGGPSKAAHLNPALEDVVRRKDQAAMRDILEKVVSTLSSESSTTADSAIS